MKGNRKLLFERRTPTGSGPFFVMFLWTLRYTTFNSIPIILILLTNKNVAFIHYVTICDHSTAVVLFLTLAGFHNQSPLLTMPVVYKCCSFDAHYGRTSRERPSRMQRLRGRRYASRTAWEKFLSQSRMEWYIYSKKIMISLLSPANYW